jgi:hypothetical protein
VTEAEARAALAAFDAIGEVEQWIAAQRWKPPFRGFRLARRLLRHRRNGATLPPCLLTLP